MDRSGEVVGDKSCTRSPLAKLWEKLRWPLASSLLTPPVALGVGWASSNLLYIYKQKLHFPFHRNLSVELLPMGGRQGDLTGCLVMAGAPKVDP